MATADTVERIIDAAERRIRQAGYNGFSFREIAQDVGIKSASVHHHFPTKPALGAAVARRYAERVEAAVAAEQQAGQTAADAWRNVFRNALLRDGRMCLCGMLGAEADGIPDEVAAEARRFFERGVESLTRAGDAAGQEAASPEAALRIMATLEGAMLLARTLRNHAIFDQATANLTTPRPGA